MAATDEELASAQALGLEGRLNSILHRWRHGGIMRWIATPGRIRYSSSLAGVGVAAAFTLASCMVVPRTASAELSWSGPHATGLSIIGAAASCPSSTQCTAVGGSGHEVTFNPNAASYPGPAAVDSHANNLFEVLCPSVDRCTALGYDDFLTANAFTFNPTLPGTSTVVHLNLECAPPVGISRCETSPYVFACSSLTLCIAPEGGTGDNRFIFFNPLMPGSALLLRSFGLFAKLFTNVTGDIACPSSTQCTVGVGFGETTGGAVTFDPASPAAQTSVALGRSNGRRIVCPTVDRCTAADGAEGFITFNPTTNTVPFIRATTEGGGTPPKYGSVEDIGCPTTRFCVAVDTKGYVLEGDPTNTAPWTRTLLDAGNELVGVTCSSVSQCVADDRIGRVFVGTGAGGTFVTPSIRSSLTRLLVPTGRGARIDILLTRGAFTLSFKALYAGVATIDWYYLPPGATLAKKKTKPGHKKKAKPALIGSGRVSFTGAATSKMKIALTATGKRLLHSSKRIRLTSRGTFTPTGKVPITATRTFGLRR